MKTKSIEHRLLSTTPLLIYASLRENPSKCPHIPYIARN